jgi:hypothetical protein
VPLALAVIAVGLAVAAAALPRLRAPLLLAAGAELALWAFLRRGHLGAAILPTDAPFWLDRGVTAAVAGAAAALVVVALRDGAIGPLGRGGRAAVASPGPAGG